MVAQDPPDGLRTADEPHQLLYLFSQFEVGHKGLLSALRRRRADA
jgi:hypothetical protein